MAKARPGRAVTGKIRHYDIHPVAEAFPLLEGDERARVKASVEAHGFLVPIVLSPDKRIVDGRGRQDIGGELGIEPPTRTLVDSDSLVMVSAALNGARRNLTKEQRMSAAEALLPHLEAEALGRQRRGSVSNDTAEGRTREVLAEILGVSPATAARVSKVFKRASSEIIDLVKCGKLSASLGERVAGLPADLQMDIALSGNAREAALSHLNVGQEPEESTPEPTAAKPRKPRKPKDGPGAWPKDAQGNDLRESMQAVFEQKSIIGGLKSAADILRRDVEATGNRNIGAYLPVDKIKDHMRSVAKLIRDSEPWAVCNECGGDGGECCRRQGWVTKRWHGLQGNKA